MALEANAATFNAAVDVLIAAWESYMTALSAGNEIQVVKMKPRLRVGHTTTTKDDNTGIDASLTGADWDFGKKFKGYLKPDVASSFKVSIGCSGPLFFKVTNALNELA